MKQTYQFEESKIDVWVTHSCLSSTSIYLISKEIGREKEKDKRGEKIGPPNKYAGVDDAFFPNWNNLLSFPAGFHVLLITLCYLVPQNYMLLNGLLMVIGFSTFLMRFTSWLLMPYGYLATVHSMHCSSLHPSFTVFLCGVKIWTWKLFVWGVLNVFHISFLA